MLSSCCLLLFPAVRHQRNPITFKETAIRQPKRLATKLVVTILMTGSLLPTEVADARGECCCILTKASDLHYSDDYLCKETTGACGSGSSTVCTCTVTWWTDHYQFDPELCHDTQSEDMLCQALEGTYPCNGTHERTGRRFSSISCTTCGSHAANAHCSACGQAASNPYAVVGDGYITCTMCGCEGSENPGCID